MSARRISRRGFLAGAAQSALMLLGPLGGRCSGVWGEGPFEGIYSDRFTYRHGETLHFHVALSSPGPVALSILRNDTPITVLVGEFPVEPSRFQRLDDPGVAGADFTRVLSLPADLLAPGLYEARLPAGALQPENVRNEHHAFPSDNTRCRFLVTEAGAGSRSRLLWLHDSLTGVCYGSFGGRSIYGSSQDPGLQVRTVSYARPGLDRGTTMYAPLRLFRQSGYEFEFIDLVALAEAPAAFLAPYDLVLAVGQFEYVPHAVLERLTEHLDRGGNLLVASDEFAAFRVRLDAAVRQLTTYKFDWESEDPYAAWSQLAPEAAAHVAGVGMNLPATFLETEVTAQTIWAAHRVTGGAVLDMTTHHRALAGWILEGTGIGAGDALPGAVHDFASGNLLAFDGAGEPSLAERDLTRTPDGTLVWASAPSPDGRAWWLADGREVGAWPPFPGHATCTLQERSSGARVVTLPKPQLATAHLDDPVYRRLLLNVIEALGGPA